MNFEQEWQVGNEKTEGCTIFLQLIHRNFKKTRHYY